MNQLKPALVLGIFICLGMVIAGWILGSSALKIKQYERIVSVKGLSEREVKADVAVWPIRFSSASQDLTQLYDSMEINTQQIQAFLKSEGFTAEEITTASPSITDKYAQQYGGNENVALRYTANQTITVYTHKIDAVRAAQSRLVALGKKGIAFGGDDSGQRTEYLYTKLNDIKPGMIEQATENARSVAEKFAADSKSSLGKIKSANQGLFSIEDRDSNTPYLKKVRVVSTVDYYLAD
ncbi:SIMPL domain-containing protein [Acinetobacter sp. ANC 4862]|uniref:SIMPL domain-containing protein n=1 Tax=Acinetobacter sp. ANC 4862 TaxID=2529849 RepID=UPI001040C50C|nr:SIMPL domain-containing protein [Acinetobacter sp. ANC 4862]TCH62965.1 SIMPL domain-containing protein [Acinetobacter sp. ANC 4862]